MSLDLKALDEGQLDLMWSFLRMGYQNTPHIGTLKELCDNLRQAMIQKTGGCRKDDPAHYVKREDLGTIINSIVIETMCLYLSSALDDLEKLYETDTNGLKPCPFCEGSAEVSKHLFGQSQITYSVTCVQCKAQIGRYADEQAAVEAWNSRGKKEGEDTESALRSE